MLTYLIEQSTPEVEYVFDFIFNTIGIKSQKINKENTSNVDIYYGNDSNYKNYLIKINLNRRDEKIFNKNDVIWQDLIEDKIKINNIEKEIPFDIIRAIKFFLLDLVNKNIELDKYDRLKAQDSFQYKHNILHIPVVNKYVLFLKKIIEEKTSIKCMPLWPDNKICAVGLSHDVDYPDKFNIKMHFKNLSRSIKQKENIRSLKNLYNLGKSKFFSLIKKNDFWLFDEIMDEEEKHGFKSTFFFASKSKLEKKASKYDILYDISDNKFSPVFKNIKDRDFEIGLHASYNCFKSLDNFFQEKEKLEKVAQVKINGVRHHYWHLGPDIEKTLSYHEQAGFEYDTSMAFEEEMGFRRSVAFPYYPWLNNQRRSARILQLPTFCMDNNLFYKPVSAESAIERLKEQIKIIKKNRGLGVIDWHIRSSLPLNKEYYEWGKVYKEILKYLSQDEEIWVTNLYQIFKFIKDRQGKLK